MDANRSDGLRTGEKRTGEKKAGEKKAGDRRGDDSRMDDKRDDRRDDADGRIELVVLDMAGTTVADRGLVEQAFAVAAERCGVIPGSDDHEAKLDYVRRTMGESKISVFRELFGDEGLAQRANREFENAYHDLIDAGGCAPLPGAVEAIERLRAGGRKVVLTTGFSRATRDRVLDALDWHGLVDLTLCPADAGRGRPYPDMVLHALLRTGGRDVRRIAVAGDTGYDMLTGRRAGASVVAGVLTGAHGKGRLAESGATHVLGSVAELPALLESR
jgi:phosphonatase-like hydrolase